MKTLKDVENIAAQLADALGQGWSAQGTVMGAQLTGPGDARIRLNLDGELVEIYAENAPRGEGVPEGMFPLDLQFIKYFVCNMLYPRYMAHLDDAHEQDAELTRWKERTRAAIERFAASAGSERPCTSDSEGAIETSFAAHGCRVDIRAHHRGEDTIRVTVPPALDLGNLNLTWNQEAAA